MCLLFLINLFLFLLNYMCVKKYILMKGFAMGRKKVDRSDKVMQTFESSKPLSERLKTTAQARGITVSALIRYILEHYFENREL